MEGDRRRRKTKVRWTEFRQHDGDFKERGVNWYRGRNLREITVQGCSFIPMADWLVWHNNDCGNVCPAENNDKSKGVFLEGWNIERIWLGSCQQLVQRAKACVCLGVFKREEVEQGWRRQRVLLLGVKSWHIGSCFKASSHVIPTDSKGTIKRMTSLNFVVYLVHEAIQGCWYSLKRVFRLWL